MRTSDAFREVLYPLFVAGLIASVWWSGYSSANGSEAPLSWPAADPALARRALAVDDDASPDPATRPTSVTSINSDAE